MASGILERQRPRQGKYEEKKKETKGWEEDEVIYLWGMGERP